MTRAEKVATAAATAALLGVAIALLDAGVTRTGPAERWACQRVDGVWHVVDVMLAEAPDGGPTAETREARRLLVDPGRCVPLGTATRTMTRAGESVVDPAEVVAEIEASDAVVWHLPVAAVEVRPGTGGNWRPAQGTGPYVANPRLQGVTWRLASGHTLAEGERALGHIVRGQDPRGPWRSVAGDGGVP